MQTTARDVAILRLALRYRFVQPQHVQLLLGGPRKKIANRLRLLWQHRYLERPRALRTSRLLMEEISYGLGQEGARLLAHVDPTLRGIAELEWAETPRKAVGWPFVDHQLGVVDTLVALELACRARGVSFEWDGHPHRRRHRLLVPGDQQGFLADATFDLRIDGRGVAHHHLELDRGSVSLGRMRDRYERYFRLWQYRRTSEPGYRFRVLTVTRDPQHMESLRRVAAEIGRNQGHPLAWRGLLFTHRDAFDLAHPEGFLEPIFYYADQKEPLALVA
jgi:Replication-relaxation